MGLDLLLQRWSKEISLYPNGLAIQDACRSILDGTATYEQQTVYAKVMDVWNDIEKFYRQLATEYPPSLCLEICSLMFTHRSN